jgi:hypothetical protein
VIIAILAGGGGSGGDVAGLKFERYPGSDAFMVDVPVGWRKTMFDEPTGGVTKTKFEDPDKEGTVEVDQEDPTPAKDRLAVAQQRAQQ